MVNDDTLTQLSFTGNEPPGCRKFDSSSKRTTNLTYNYNTFLQLVPHLNCTLYTTHAHTLHTHALSSPRFPPFTNRSTKHNSSIGRVPTLNTLGFDLMDPAEGKQTHNFADFKSSQLLIYILFLVLPPDAVKHKLTPTRPPHFQCITIHHHTH